MKATLQLLIDGDTHAVEYYQNALNLWREILEDPGVNDINALAQEISIQKQNFELSCGGVPCAHEIMILTGIAQFFDECGEFCEDSGRLEAVLRALGQCHFGNEKRNLLQNTAHLYCDDWIVSLRGLINTVVGSNM